MAKDKHQDQAIEARRGGAKIRDLPKDDQPAVRRLLSHDAAPLRERIMREDNKTMTGVHYKFRNLVTS